VEKSGVHYFNMFKIAYSRAGWVLSLPNTIGILFLIWTNAYFQDNYSKYFLYNFWFFMVCLIVPYLAYMVFEYKRVWSAEIEISNQRSWLVGYNPVRDLLLENARELKELKAMVKTLEGRGKEA
jgi:hypothetical protein